MLLSLLLSCNLRFLVATSMRRLLPQSGGCLVVVRLHLLLRLYNYL